MPKQPVEYGEVVEPDLHGRVDGGVARVWINAANVQIGDVQQGCKQFLFCHDGLPG